ncbi:conserved hypothetical protein [Afipia carboxidovorans OM5]|uniref:DUF1236 domain-containing protein n=1 Tax=Afipia carboxidovorans (strain ATCC 49405 / DSM 1227 / KCTC 32145 / OM5) TaxID=504832 RepID=B6JDG8_AFIC5|nr:DUF1236 domain-containing protein [Afipia carboxidovorans]ACI91880.1 conserved hypothetical protein [Afipia carboxidovorans OM5]AEI04258.1 hypothetical protein OCA4_c31580 [Afipia carboxidovorans OM4]AEI07888.1 hypothetical protein OCA5_c32100 [Afipia carboxidovorans OM5]
MRNRFMTSLAALTILAGTGAAFGQGTGTREAPSGGTSTQSPSAAPDSGMRSGSSGVQMKGAQSPDSQDATPQQKSSQSGEGMRGSRQNAQDNRPDRMKGPQSTEDRSKGERTKGAESEGARKNGNMNAERRGTETDSKQRSQTTGQAGAGAKLSTEQRTKITSVIREQRVQPETNVNFNISVGTRVPRSVHFHPLPADIITIYPGWRGYEFFLVRDEIIVVNPRTLEIVAVLEA